MKLIPCHHLEFVVPTSPDRAVEMLRPHVTPWRWLRWTRHWEVPSFMGEVGAEGFRLALVLGYRNNFAPVLHGRLEPVTGGTKVSVRMMPHPVPLAAAGLLLGVLVFLFGPLAWQADREGSSAPLIVIGVMILFTLALGPVCFWWEVPKAERLLKQFFGLE